MKKRLMSNTGFTMIELVVVVTLLALIIAIVVPLVNVNMAENKKKTLQSRLISDFTAMESALGFFVTTKNDYPTHASNLLSDTNFVPSFLMPPKVSSELDTSYGVNGYLMFKNDSGYYVCVKTPAVTSSSEVFKTIKDLALNYPNKIYYNTTCPSSSNMTDPDTATQVIVTYWMVRF